MSTIRRTFLALLLFILLAPAGAVQAQEGVPAGPVYIVQSGDTLTSIADQFGITQAALLEQNNISDPNLLAVGDELVIPGLEGLTGYLVTRKVDFGSTLDLLAAQNHVDRGMLIRLNHLTSPSELYIGTSLIIPEDTDKEPITSMFLLGVNQSLLEAAVLSNTNPWRLASVNQLPTQNSTPSGSILLDPSGDGTQRAGLQQVPIGNFTIQPLPLVQGKTITFRLPDAEGIQVGGSLAGYPLHFFPDGNGNMVCLQGIHAMQTPGLYPLNITLSLPGGQSYVQEQTVVIQDGYFNKDPVLMVKDEFIDPATTQPELDWLTAATQPATAERLWDGIWTSPSPYSYLDCLNSRYGNRRSYNGGPFDFFHTGVDFCGGDGVPIYAPAPGKVIFSGPLTVRGNATLIDHGWGVYSGYYHQSELSVKAGDMVATGQEIGKVGATGRVTGAHLHWEIWVGGVQVNPLEWLENGYPAQ